MSAPQNPRADAVDNVLPALKRLPRSCPARRQLIAALVSAALFNQSGRAKPPWETQAVEDLRVIAPRLRAGPKK